MTARSSGKKILVYSQDVGGARYIAPVLSKISKKLPLIIVAHPLSEAVFKDFGISYQTLFEFFKMSKPGEDDIKSALVENNISGIFCTVSSPHPDLINANLIRISKMLDIETFGVMDHWKGLDRFFDKSGEPSYLPDFIGCIDRYARRELLKFYRKPNRVYIMGHPYLERCLAMDKNRDTPHMAVRILIVSQPYVADGSFKSIFLKEINSTRMIDEILKGLKEVEAKKRLQIIYRAHPKENRNFILPDGVKKDTEETGKVILLENDIFIGLNSMLLAEAYLAGGNCIVVDFPWFSKMAGNAIPYAIGNRVNKTDEIGPVLSKTIKLLDRHQSQRKSALAKAVKDSLGRSLCYLKRFINYNLKKERDVIRMAS